ncbi:MAG: anthrone oxygenase family protein [Micromonosporaceae bacterium]
MDYLTLAALAVGGFTACAEFGAYAFVHPAIRRLPSEYHLAVEQGLLRTFGRVMPVLMPLTLVIAIVVAWVGRGAAPEAGPVLWRWLAVAGYASALASTVIVNVPINIATGRWDPTNPPEDWRRHRARWEYFQGVRSWLLLAGFFATCIGVATD